MASSSLFDINLLKAVERIADEIQASKMKLDFQRGFKRFGFNKGTAKTIANERMGVYKCLK